MKRMRHVCLSMLVVAAVAAGEENPRLRCEAGFMARHLKLLAFSCTPGEGEAALSLSFTPEVLRTHELYLVNPREPAAYIHVAADGTTLREDRSIGRMERTGTILATRSRLSLFLDDVCAAADLKGWNLYWAAAEVRKPALVRQRFPTLVFCDGFMREEIGNDNWKTACGTWRLNRNGAGVPRDLRDETAPRAANPFSAIGSSRGTLECAAGKIAHGYVEARFFFGTPRQAHITDTNTLPASTDMLVGVGAPDGEQIAFGWLGEQRRFGLVARKGHEAWRMLQAWEGKRPAIACWTRLRLQLENGIAAIGFLDGVEAVRVPLPGFLTGSGLILTGESPVEFDDVRVWSLPVPEEAGAPVFRASRLFAAKQKMNQTHDPPAYEEWTRGTDAFLPFEESSEREHVRFIVCRKPLFGDFQYESVPFEHSAGPLPKGRYEFRVLAGSGDRPVPASKHPVLYSVRFDLSEKGWRPAGTLPEGWPAEHHEFTLRLRRDHTQGNRLMVLCRGAYIPVSEPLIGAVHLAIGRFFATTQVGSSPYIEHHMIYDPHLLQELFEEAPTEWSWLDGSFRMDCRWACSNQWGFLGGASVSAPCLVSKNTFYGDQIHDGYISVRPVFPWDIGDTRFTYDPDEDHEWVIFGKNEGWYNRHDLNFSFCTDGLNPLSGYAVIFGGDENSETRLLRRGTCVASTREARFRIPANPRRDPRTDDNNIHWAWWHITANRQKGLIRVYLNHELMFSFEDPEPIAGGHIMFWSLRNGFTVARANSVAERLERAPHVLYVSESDAAPWKPLQANAVTVHRQKEPLSTRVTLNNGAGFHAVRYSFQPNVDLRKTPRLRLPVRIPPGVKVNAHLAISGNAYLIELSAPLAGMKSLLTPAYEKREQFRVPVIPEPAIRTRYLLGRGPVDGTVEIDLLAALRALGKVPATAMLESITIGNTSNEAYLLAGHGGNEAGLSYELGTPQILEASNAANP